MYMPLSNIYWFVVADKLTVKQHCQFEVITIDQEGRWQTVMTIIPVNMEGNPAGTKIIYTLNLPWLRLPVCFYSQPVEAFCG